MNRKKKKGQFIYIILVLVLLVVALYSVFQILSATVFKDEQKEVVSTTSKTIVRDNVGYFPRQDIDVLLFMGIDRTGSVEDSGSYNNDGEADTVMLLVVDQTEETFSILQLNRDTMVDIPVLGVGGRQADSIFGQLALAHTYGSGLEDSCENTVKTVSDLLYGITIDHYIAMNMDAIALVNDAVGGVTVNVVDDFSEVDASITMGEMTLYGEQATSFVQTRKDVGDQLNLSRMERQKEYMDGFLEAYRSKMKENSNLTTKIYNEVADYVVTDCSVTTLSSMMERYADYELKEVVTPEGENKKGEEYIEFYLDEEALDELILRMFFAPKN